MTSPSSPSKKDIRTWRRNLAEERAEGAIYRAAAAKTHGVDSEILNKLADAEERHAQYWIDKLGPHVGKPVRPSVRTRILGFFTRRFGTLFALALMQVSEERVSASGRDGANDQITADEKIHQEVVRALATRGREEMSGTFRAAIFGVNDGLVSNLALVLGVGATGISNGAVLLTGMTGLLAGALSMAAGEFISVSSQRELLQASTPDPSADSALPQLDVNANELALIYQARGMSAEDAEAKADQLLRRLARDASTDIDTPAAKTYDEVGSGVAAATSSFVFFGIGALLPVLPYLLGMTGMAAMVTALAVVGLALMCTGGAVGILSGRPPMPRALRQLAIGYGAAGVTYILGLLFGTTLT